MSQSQARQHAPLRSNFRVPQDSVREVTRNGRDYLVFPIVALREAVINYPENGTKEYLPSESISQTSQLWAGKPLTFIHPQNRRRTANDPDSYTGEHIGQAHEPEMISGNQKLRVNGWLDIEKAKSIGGLAADVVEKLRSGAELSVSAGYGTIGDQKVNGTYNGESYNVKQGTVMPNHIAIFPTSEFNARLTPEDGVAAPRANAVDATMNQDEDVETLGRKFFRALGFDTKTNNGSESETDDGADDGSDADDGSESGDADGDGPDDDSDETTESTDTDGSNSSDTAETEMSNHDIEDLAGRSSFDEETLSEWDDDQLAALTETLEQAAETDSETPPTPDGTDGPESPEGADGADGEFAEMKQNFRELQEELQSIKQSLERNERGDDLELVCNAFDMDEDEAMSMPDSAFEKLASQAREQQAQQQTVNYGGMPGQKDRTPEPEEGEWEDYPAGGRSAWKKRQEQEN